MFIFTDSPILPHLSQFAKVDVKSNFAAALREIGSRRTNLLSKLNALASEIENLNGDPHSATIARIKQQFNTIGIDIYDSDPTCSDLLLLQTIDNELVI